MQSGMCLAFHSISASDKQKHSIFTLLLLHLIMSWIVKISTSLGVDVDLSRCLIRAEISTSQVMLLLRNPILFVTAMALLHDNLIIGILIAIENFPSIYSHCWTLFGGSYHSNIIFNLQFWNSGNMWVYSVTAAKTVVSVKFLNLKGSRTSIIAGSLEGEIFQDFPGLRSSYWSIQALLVENFMLYSILVVGQIWLSIAW